MAISIPIISEFDGKGIDKAVKQFKDLETTSQKAQFAIKKAAVPAAAALAGLTAVIGDSVNAAMEDAKAQALLARTLENTTGANQQQLKSVEKMIAKMSIQTAIADDELRPAYANLARNTRDLDRANRLLSVAMDISAATGKDLESVTIALGKAENGQYTALKKLGIPLGENASQLNELNKSQKILQKAYVELEQAQASLTDGITPHKEAMSDLQKAQEKVAKWQAVVNDLNVSGLDYVKDLDEAFGGMAETAAMTAEGGMKRLSISIGEAKESLGAAFLPVVEAALPKLQKFAEWAMENPELLRNVAIAIGSITGATLALNAAMAANPYVLAAAGIVALAMAFERLGSAFQKAEGVLKFLLGAANLAVGAAIPGFLGGAFRNFFGGGGGGSTNTSRPGGGMAIPKMADGGMVTGPTLALIGEAGPEAVVPLDRMGGMGNVTINVNGGDPRAVVDALRTYMSRYGSIPIRTVAP
jgi:exonuclease VII small subunit